MKKRVTLRDVGAAAGVHFTTAGLAVRGDPRLDPATVARIIAVANKLGYQSDPLLSALARLRHGSGMVFHGVIGCVLDFPKRQLTAGQKVTLASAEKHASSLGFRTEIFELHNLAADGRTLARILRARGIRGIILPPMYEPGTFPEMDWSKLSVTAIGYSILSPVFHRVCPHQPHTLREELRELEALGYRRIGLAMTPGANARTENNFLGTYLAHRYLQSPSDQIDPLITSTFEKPEVERWLARFRPDCVIASEGAWCERLKEMGMGIPRKMGFAGLGRRPELPHVAGFDERMDLLGEVAVDTVVSLLTKGETGIPKSPSTTLVEGGQWNPGSTVRLMR